MGLKLQFTDAWGNQAEYLKISELANNFPRKTGKVVIELWKDRDTSKNGSFQPVGLIVCPLRTSEKKQDGITQLLQFSKFAEALRVDQYAELKNHKFSSPIGGTTIDFDLTLATDVLE